MDTLAEKDRSDSQTVLASAKRPESVEAAVRRAQAHLIGLQAPDGYWSGELEADASVSAGYILLMYFMLGKVDPVRQQKVVAFVLSKQNPDGSWPSYFGGPGDLNATIQVYFALKLAGLSVDAPMLRSARDFVRARGGIRKAGVFTKIWLAIFGQYDWRGTPSVPPELTLLPNWFYFNIYEFASWSRETIVALMVVLTNHPVCLVPESARVDELYVEPEARRDYSLGKKDGLNWRSFFLVADSVFKLWERLPIKPGRRHALGQAERWIVEHQEADGSWGGIMLPWVYSLIALKSLGYPLDHPVIARGLQGLEGFIAEDSSTLRLLPATSPVWDTAWAVLALSASGLPPEHPALRNAGRWLRSQEIRAGGDWRIKNPNTEPGCWAFEFHNDFYPDMDDSAVVPRALLRVRLEDVEEGGKAQAIERSARWVVSMQSKDGGWAAFDLNNDKTFLSHVPFADFMTPLDPTCADVTAHVVELLAEIGTYSRSLEKAVAYLRSTQELDGAWYGRWGVNYLYGTGLVLAAMCAAGQDMGQPWIQKAVAWLRSRQNSDGGWGESCHSYADSGRRGEGESTASQTAWALMGLMAAGEAAGQSVQRGIDYLVRNQGEDGTWREDLYTGTGFPRAFYLRYDLYRSYFPLMALSRYESLQEG